MNSNKKYNIIIVDDQEIFRSGLKLFLENELNHKVIAEASNGKKFLELNNIHKSDIILMDIQMPVLDGLEASKQILKRYSNLKIIAITMYHDKAYLKDLVERGIKGFVHKSSTFNDLDKILDLVYHNKFFFPDDLKVEME